MPAFHKEIKEYLGCLSKKRTPDEAAKRRQRPELDEDLLVMSISGHDFAVDALQKIGPSKAFRRLEFKTQVLTAAINAHVRNRLVHTFEVANAATTIARILGLNENLCLAIALGHDIGHPPFGHLGESFISEITGKNFHHATFGVIIAQHIERQGWGLNLTYQVLQGILNHSKGYNDLAGAEDVSEEAKVGMYADKFAHIWADIKDVFVRTRTLDFVDYPEIKELADLCGKNQRERIAFCIKNLCAESAQKGCVSFQESKAAQIFYEVKDRMRQVYRKVNLQTSAEILEKIYLFLSKTDLIEDIDPAVVLALMTDADVLYLYRKDCINIKDFNDCSVAEISPSLKGKKIDFLNPDLNW